MEARYTPQVRHTLDARLQYGAIVGSMAAHLIVVWSAWGTATQSTVLLLFVLRQTGDAVASWLSRGVTQRLPVNAFFTVWNIALTSSFGYFTDWGLPALLLVPLNIAIFEMFGEGDDRPFALVQIAFFGVLLALCASVTTAFMVVTLTFTIWWLTTSRSELLRRSLAAVTDATAQKENEMKSRLQTELELRQAQKLESVGRLAAGVAHEINTPVQFVSDNITFLSESIVALLNVISAYRKAVPLDEQLAAIEEEADLTFVVENLPDALDSVREGLQRITTIVRSMRDFAHPEQKALSPVDVNRAINTVLTICASEYRLVADVVTELGVIPMVMGHRGELSQVMLNLIVNAAHAIDEIVKKGGPRGRITVHTERVGEEVLVRISDTGVGIADDIREHIFDPFFTTKEVGKGTGQGLAIARSVIERHGGTIGFTTETGEGTTFEIRLPITQTESSEGAT